MVFLLSLAHSIKIETGTGSADYINWIAGHFSAIAPALDRGGF
jgi:hypothetical protein